MDEYLIEQQQAREELAWQKAMESRVRYEGESAEDCIACGAEIAPARRLALPGVDLCVECAREAEVKRAGVCRG